MRILVTGANGFSAGHLISLLLADGHSRIYQTDVKIGQEGKCLCCDLSDSEAADELITEVKPDRIYHLAGSFSNQYETDYRANALATKNLLDSILKQRLSCRVLLIGSSAEYGNISECENPVDEDHALAPVSLYGLTKAYQTLLMKFYVSAHNMDIVMARTFNLFGKGLSEKLFVGRVYKQIEDYKRGSISRIKLGNLESKRDYIDVGTAVKYYLAIMDKGISGHVYNVGSGKSVKMRDLLLQILQENNLSMDIVESRQAIHSDKVDINEISANTAKLMDLMNR